MRYLLKDIDHFAGFAHAINTYLSGVALADLHDMSLLHRPFVSAHGMGFAFDDFLMGDARGLVWPLAAPALVDGGDQLLIDGVAASLSSSGKTASANSIAARLGAAPAGSLTWVRKGRFAFASAPYVCNCTVYPEVRYTALWIRERFWRAAVARERAAAVRAGALAVGGAAVGGVAGAGAAGGPEPITVAVHVRRGDVTWLDKFGKPSSRWVEVGDMLDVLRGVRSVLGVPLEAPAVKVLLFSEHKGWLVNDTAALREVAPHAAVHLDSSAPATIDAMVAMSRADLLLMGSSGFSVWSAIFSCGVKVGARSAPLMPMRHVPFANTLTTRGAPFDDAALPALRAAWAEYSGCKRDPACRPTLCAPKHIADPRWTQSRLATELAAQPGAAQWTVPLGPPGAHALAAEPPGRATDISGWRAAGALCARGGDTARCVRTAWLANMSAFLSARKRVMLAPAAAPAAARKGGGGGGGGGGGRPAARSSSRSADGRGSAKERLEALIARRVAGKLDEAAYQVARREVFEELANGT